MAEVTTPVVETPEVKDDSLIEGNPAAVEEKNDSPEESDSDLDPKTLKAKLKEKQNREINLTKRLKDAETELKVFKDAQLSEQEKLKQRAEEAEGKGVKYETGLKNLLLKNKVNDLKTSHGLRSTNAIVKLIDSDSIEYDLEKFEVSGVEDALKQLKKSDPDLFIIGGTDGGKGGDIRASASMNDKIRSLVGRS